MDSCEERFATTAKTLKRVSALDVTVKAVGWVCRAA